LSVYQQVLKRNRKNKETSNNKEESNNKETSPMRKAVSLEGAILVLINQDIT
jgi:hypothetical protein